MEKIFILFICGLLTVSQFGCALFQKNKHFVINDSQLNWMTIKYIPADPKELPFYLNILGAGSIEIKEGRSPRVFNSLSQDVNNKYWDDIFEETMPLSKEEARWLMQLIVDEGFINEPERMKSLSREERTNSENGFASISAKLNTKPYGVHTNNPKIIELVKIFAESIRTNRGFK